MTRVKPPSSHPQGFPVDESPGRPSLLRRIGIGRLVFAVALLAIATAQVLTTGDQAPRSQPSAPAALGITTTGPALRPAVAGKPLATSKKARVTKPKPVAPHDGKAATPEKGAKPDHGRADEHDPRFGVPIDPAVFECKPVRKDATVTKDQFAVPLAPFSKGVFPCTRCHDKPQDFNATKRTLTLDHTNIKLVHGPREQWCYGCHNPGDRDKLRLAGGRTVTFQESYELCGQCHGPKLRDWRAGIHGRRTGCWNGKRQYLLCVHCHSPHAPKFKAVKPEPRPKRPSEIQLPKQAARGK